jgi:hypothetical protein
MSLQNNSTKTWPLKTFYVTEKHAVSTIGNYDKVEQLLRACVDHTTTTDDAIRGFMKKLPNLQRDSKKIKNSRISAVVFRWITDGGDTIIYYNFSTFVDKTGKEQYKKTDIHKTAVGRFYKHAHMITLNNDDVINLDFMKNIIKKDMITRRKTMSDIIL